MTRHGHRLAQSDLLVHKVNVGLDILRAARVNRVSYHVVANIVTVDDSRCGDRDMELLKQLAKPTTLVHKATAQYSTSALEHETVVCCLDDQDTRLSPR